MWKWLKHGKSVSQSALLHAWRRCTREASEPHTQRTMAAIGFFTFEMGNVANGPVYPSPPQPLLFMQKACCHRYTDSSKPQGLELQSSIKLPVFFFFFFIVAMFLVCPTFKTQDAQFRVESRTRTSCRWWVVGFVVWGGHQNQWKRAGRMEEELWAVRFELRIATSMAGHTHSFSEVMIIHREEMQNREVKHFGRKWNLTGRHVYKGVYKYFSLLASLLFVYRS